MRRSTSLFSKNVVLGLFFDKKGKEKLIKHELRFIYSFKFMSFPLADLVKNLVSFTPF